MGAPSASTAWSDCCEIRTGAAGVCCCGRSAGAANSPRGGRRPPGPEPAADGALLRRLQAGRRGPGAAAGAAGLRDPGRTGPRRHGRGLQGAADVAEAAGGPEGDRRGAWAGADEVARFRPRPRPSPSCSTRTSCRSTRSASTKVGPSSRWSTSRAAPWPAASAARRMPPRAAAELVAHPGAGHARRPPARHRPPRPEAGQRAASFPQLAARRRRCSLAVKRLWSPRSPISAWPSASAASPG